MIALAIAVTTLIAISLYLVGRSSRARTVLANFTWLMEFSLVTFGAFIGLLLSLFAHDFLRERDMQAEYINSLIRVRDVAIDHLISVQSLLSQASSIEQVNSEDAEDEQLQSLADQLFLLELQTVNRAKILVGANALLPKASAIYLSGLETMSIVAQLKPVTTLTADDLQDAIADSRFISAYLLFATHAELALARGNLSQRDLDTYYRCRLDSRRRPWTEQGYDDFCADDMRGVEEWLRNSVDHEDDAEQLDDCLSEDSTATVTVCAGLIKRVVN